MSDTAGPVKTISDFEARLDQADRAVASFAEDDLSLLSRVRGFLRAQPTAIPAIILIVSVLAFGAVATNFMSAGTLSLILKQVTVVELENNPAELSKALTARTTDSAPAG
mgnify:CR=1 FL=1